MAIHNVHQYDGFFESLRSNIGNLPTFVESYIQTNLVDKSKQPEIKSITNNEG